MCAKKSQQFEYDIAKIEKEGEASVSLGGRPFTIKQQFLEDIQGQTNWRQDTQVAMDAAAVGLAAEKSVIEKSRVQLG